MWPTEEEYLLIRQAVAESGEGAELIHWYETVLRPSDACDLALRLAFVIIASGFRYEISKGIADRVEAALRAGQRVFPRAFAHHGKAEAIERIWRNRDAMIVELNTLSDGDVLDWCEGLHWIGPVTKYHAAKDLGVNIAKPDRWMERLAATTGETVQGMCERIATASGDRIATVDFVLWYAASHGILLIDADGVHFRM